MNISYVMYRAGNRASDVRGCYSKSKSDKEGWKDVCGDRESRTIVLKRPAVSVYVSYVTYLSLSCFETTC